MKERLKTPGESVRTKLLLSEILNKVNNFWLIIVLYFIIRILPYCFCRKWYQSLSSIAWPSITCEFYTKFWVCHWCSYHIQSLLKSIGEQTHDNHESTWFNPLHPYIRIHLLHTLLCMFPLVLTRRIYRTIKVSLGWRSFPLFSWP